ncbi:MAG: hypothetical protein C5B50_29375 [Verrucomicrobia bacterium]|nr:MAG: hypothetical protein C5B50_29375 [Verrucomicrobiota bacterium]
MDSKRSIARPGIKIGARKNSWSEAGTRDRLALVRTAKSPQEVGAAALESDKSVVRSCPMKANSLGSAPQEWRDSFFRANWVVMQLRA